MAVATPWERGEQDAKEFGQQSALIQWRNMAASMGIAASLYPESYTTRGEATKWRSSETDEWSKQTQQPPGLWKPPTELEWLHAIKNQGHGDVIRGSKSKMEGVEAGVFDLFFPFPLYMPRNEIPLAGALSFGSHYIYCGLYIEMKRANGKPSDVSKAQEDFQGYARSKGYAAEVCFGWEQAAQTLLVYLGYLRGVDPEPNGLRRSFGL